MEITIKRLYCDRCKDLIEETSSVNAFADMEARHSFHVPQLHATFIPRENELDKIRWGRITLCPLCEEAYRKVTEEAARIFTGFFKDVTC